MVLKIKIKAKIKIQAQPYKKPLLTETQMTDEAMQIQLQCVLDELKTTSVRLERAEKQIQMLTDTFVISGLLRTSSSLEKWRCAADNSDMLQFDLTND